MAFLHTLAGSPGRKVATGQAFSRPHPCVRVFWLAGMLTPSVCVRPSLASVGVSWPSAHGACSSARGPVTFSFPVRSRQRGSTLFLAGLVLLAAGLVLPRAALALA